METYNIVLIVVGCVVVLAGIGVGLYFYFKKRKKETNLSLNNETEYNNFKTMFSSIVPPNAEDIMTKPLTEVKKYYEPARKKTPSKRQKTTS